MVFLTILAVILLIVGAVGTVFPALPGLALMLGGAFLLGYGSDYQIVGTWTLTLIAVVCALGMAMDFLAGILGAKYTGASKQALWGAFIGGLVGVFLGVVGLIFAPLVGAAVGEFVAKRDMLLAGKVGIGTFIGFIVGTVAKIGAALVVLLLILGQYLVHWLA